MTTIGWVTDHPKQSGRAISIQNFRDAKPEDIELADIDLTDPAECDAYIVHSNSVPKNLPLMPKSMKPGPSKSKPVIMYSHQWDIISFGASIIIYQSPFHATIHKYGKSLILPPPIVEADYLVEKEIERQPKALWSGTANKEEGFDVAVRWSETKKIPTDFIGVNIPQGADTTTSKFRGWVDHKIMPQLLREYQKLIYFPRQERTFDRMLVEALIAGCELEVWGRLGIESFEKPLEEVVELCKSSTQMFWKIVEDSI